MYWFVVQAARNAQDTIVAILYLSTSPFSMSIGSSTCIAEYHRRLEIAKNVVSLGGVETLV
jgi:hypothetical protein